MPASQLARENASDHISSSDDAINLIGNNASGNDLDDTHGFLPGATFWARTKH